MLLNDHAGLYGPGHIEPGSDERSTRIADLRDERLEELEWETDQIVARTGLPSGLVRLVLNERDAVVAEADAA